MQLLVVPTKDETKKEQQLNKQKTTVVVTAMGCFNNIGKILRHSSVDQFDAVLPGHSASITTLCLNESHVSIAAHCDGKTDELPVPD